MSEVNDVIDTIEAINTFGKYPFATIIHVVVGGIAGWLLYCGRELCKWGINGTSSSLMGLTIFAGWITYELAEFARIADDVDKDIANGLLGLFVGIIIGKLIWHYGIAEIEREKEENGRESAGCNENDAG